MAIKFSDMQAIWSAHIPLVNAMQVDYHIDGDQWTLNAPLAANCNHMGTGFGGSIAALATLAGWAQTWLLLDDPYRYDIVIASSTINYHAPATAELIASTVQPIDSTRDKFSQALSRKNRGRLEITCHVHSNDILAATLVGHFAAIRRDPT